MIHCFNLFRDHMLSIYVLRTRDVSRLQTACSRLCLQRGARSILHDWLVCEEAGRGSQHIDIQSLEFECHAARLLRMTLRRIQNLHTPIIIIGSYPALTYAERENCVHERLNDIDIWVFNEATVSLMPFTKEHSQYIEPAKLHSQSLPLEDRHHHIRQWIRNHLYDYKNRYDRDPMQLDQIDSIFK